MNLCPSVTLPQCDLRTVRFVFCVLAVRIHESSVRERDDEMAVNDACQCGNDILYMGQRIALGGQSGFSRFLSSLVSRLPASCLLPPFFPSHYLHPSYPSPSRKASIPSLPHSFLLSWIPLASFFTTHLLLLRQPNPQNSLSFKWPQMQTVHSTVALPSRLTSQTTTMTIPSTRTIAG